ncbi:MAG: hypothetical protein ACI8RA_000821, partial [Chlamydiales bacterium]
MLSLYVILFKELSFSSKMELGNGFYVISIYCIFEDLLNFLGVYEDPQNKIF